MNKKQVNIAVTCMVTYNTIIEVPEDYSLEEAVNYAKEHINEINGGELNWISDSDEIDDENCYFIEEEEQIHENFTLIIKKVDKLPKDIDPKCPLIEPEDLNEIFKDIKKGLIEDNTILLMYKGNLYNAKEANNEKQTENITLIIKNCKSYPYTLDWDYPLAELDYLLEQIESGDRENNSTMLLYCDRLYEII